MNSLPILTIGIVLLASCGINLKKRGLMIDRTKIERTRKTSALEDESRESVRSIKNQESILYSDSSSTSSPSIELEAPPQRENEIKPNNQEEHTLPDQEQEDSKSSFYSRFVEKIKKWKESFTNQGTEELEDQGNVL